MPQNAMGATAHTRANRRLQRNRFVTARASLLSPPPLRLPELPLGGLDGLVAAAVTIGPPDEELGVQGLVVREAYEPFPAVLGHEHWHDELLGPHLQPRPGPEHEVVYSLGALGAAGVSVAEVAEGGEPRVKGGPRVTVEESILHRAPEIELK